MPWGPTRGTPSELEIQGPVQPLCCAHGETEAQGRDRVQTALEPLPGSCSVRPLSSESWAHSATASQAPDGPGLPARVCLGTVGRLFRARTHSPQKPRAMVSNLELAVSAGRCRTCGLCGGSSGGGVSPRQAWNAGATSSCVGRCFVEIALWSAKGTHVDMRLEERGAAALLHPDHSWWLPVRARVTLLFAGLCRRQTSRGRLH